MRLGHCSSTFGQVDGIFLIDKRGIVRFARSGFGVALLPTDAELVRLLGESAESS